MRLSTLVLALIPATFATPIPAPALSLDGLFNALKGSIQRPDLFIARLEVVTGLAQTRSALQSIINETASGDNKAVNIAAKAALDSANKAQSAVDSILKDILSGEKPELSNQKAVAQGIIGVQEQISSLKSAIVKPSKKLAKDIKNAEKAVALLVKGGKNVLAASGLKLGDVGLKPPPTGSGTTSSTPSASSTKDAKAPVDTGAPAKKAPPVGKNGIPLRVPELDLVKLGN